MRIHLRDHGHLPYLLAYLRDNGCVADLADDEPAIVASAPDFTAIDELRVIRGLASLWHCAHPTAELDFSDHLHGLGPHAGALTARGRETHRDRSGPMAVASRHRVPA